MCLKLLKKNKFDRENFSLLEVYLNEKLTHNYFDIELIAPFQVKSIIDKL